MYSKYSLVGVHTQKESRESVQIQLFSFALSSFKDYVTFR